MNRKNRGASPGLWMIGVAALLSDVSWAEVLSASLLSAILSILMSIGGLPEAKESESIGNIRR